MTDVPNAGSMQKDRTEKNLEGYNDVFADVSNNLIFKAPLIKEEDLLPGPTESVFKADTNDSLREQRRDVSKYIRGSNTIVSLVGLENQTAIDKDMGIRMMGYDYGSYRQQIDTGKERYGVVSAVLYFGKKPWTAGNTIKQQLNIPKELSPYVSNYSYHLIDVPRLSKKKRDSLTSDFKVVADFFAMKDKKNYKPSEQVLVHVEAVLHMLKTFTSDQRYQEIEKGIMSEVEKGSAITMCDFAERMEQKGIKLRTEQLNKLILSLAKVGRADDIVRAAENPELEEKFMKEFHIV